MEKVTGSRTQSIGIGFAVAAAVAFGTLAVLAKLAYRTGVGFFPLLAVRFTLAALFLAGYHLAARRSLAVGTRNIVRLLLLGGFGYAVEASLFFLALTRAPASIVTLVFYSYPLWTTLIAIAIGMERFTLRLCASLITGSAGVLLIFSIRNVSLDGPLFALIASVAVAVYYVLAQVVSEDVPASAAATYTAAGAGLVLSFAAGIARGPLPAVAIGYAAALAAATGIAFVATYAAISRIGSTRTVIANMLEPVTTVVLAALVLGESLTIRVLAGMVLIVAALPILASVAHRDAGPPAADTA